MHKTIWVGVVAGLLTVGVGAQTAKDAEKNLRDGLLKKRLFLRGFSEDSTIEWKWNGKELVEDQPKFLTLGALTVKSVKLNGEKIVIQGDRQILVRTEGRNVQFNAEIVPVTINVDLHGANVAEVLPTLPGALFYSDLNNGGAADFEYVCRIAANAGAAQEGCGVDLRLRASVRLLGQCADYGDGGDEAPGEQDAAAGDESGCEICHCRCECG